MIKNDRPNHDWLEEPATFKVKAGLRVRLVVFVRECDPDTTQSVEPTAAFFTPEAQLNDRHVAATLINDLPELHLDLVPACLAPDDDDV